MCCCFPYKLFHWLSTEPRTHESLAVPDEGEEDEKGPKHCTEDEEEEEEADGEGEAIGTAQVSLYLSLLQECLTDAWVTGSSGRCTHTVSLAAMKQYRPGLYQVSHSKQKDSVWTACKLWSKHCHSHITFVNLLYTSQHLVTFFLSAADVYHNPVTSQLWHVWEFSQFQIIFQCAFHGASLNNALTSGSDHNVII